MQVCWLAWGTVAPMLATRSLPIGPLPVSWVAGHVTEKVEDDEAAAMAQFAAGPEPTPKTTEVPFGSETPELVPGSTQAPRARARTGTRAAIALRCSRRWVGVVMRLPEVEMTPSVLSADRFEGGLVQLAVGFMSPIMGWKVATLWPRAFGDDLSCVRSLTAAAMPLINLDHRLWLVPQARSGVSSASRMANVSGSRAVYDSSSSLRRCPTTGHR